MDHLRPPFLEAHPQKFELLVTILKCFWGLGTLGWLQSIGRENKIRKTAKGLGVYLAIWPHAAKNL
jgi:hypothetical protein